jgi:opacity protein-like surface antigen
MIKSLKIACSAMALMVALGSVAEARDGFYLTGRGGMTWNNFNSKKDSVTDKKVSKLDHVSMYAGAIGYKYKYVRGELEYIWRDDAEEAIMTYGVHTSDMTLSSQSIMANIYIDLMPNYWISPYVGGGLGITRLELTDKNTGFAGNDEHWKENKFTWQLGAGLTIRINRCLNIDGGYRYFTLGKIDGAEVNAHEWYGGIRYTF